MENHEQLTNLLGGNENGHYHLTHEQLDWVTNQMSGQTDEPIKPVIADGQVVVVSIGKELQGYKIETNLNLE